MSHIVPISPHIYLIESEKREKHEKLRSVFRFQPFLLCVMAKWRAPFWDTR